MDTNDAEVAAMKFMFKEQPMKKLFVSDIIFTIELTSFIVNKSKP